MSAQIIDLAQWFQTPAGHHLRDWELQQCDQAVADCFGYHALQMGGEHLPLLRNSRVQHRWLAGVEALPPAAPATEAAAPGLVLEPRALPFAEASLDLVVLPHMLEASADPHAVLREVARVLVPEGRVLVIGFNPLSLWGAQQHYSVWMQKMGGRRAPFIPDVDDLIGQHRLRDWMQLLNLDVTGGRFGCYRPGLQREKWFERLGWLERAGDRWWPVLGGVYFLEAVKRVRGVRMIQPRWKAAKQARNSVPVAQRDGVQRQSGARP